MKTLTPKEKKRLELFTKKVGRGINRFDMLHEGERVLIGVSGGKDSLALSFALAARLQWLPVRYDLEALFINWREYPVGDDDWRSLQAFFRDLGIPLHRHDASMFPPSFNGRFDCYRCSRNKRRILFTAAERLGIRKIALGHHMDDMIETTLMNLCFHGEFSTMMPVQEFFKGKITLIRPMCEVKEQEINRVVKLLSCPALSVNCPRKNLNKRIVIKEVVRTLSRINKRVRENIFNAPGRINKNYLPFSLHPPLKFDSMGGDRAIRGDNGHPCQSRSAGGGILEDRDPETGPDPLSG